MKRSRRNTTLARWRACLQPDTGHSLRKHSKRGLVKRPLSALCLALLCAAGTGIHAGTITVTSTLDDGSGGTLREALATAMDDDVIDATGISGTILLASGELVVDKNITLVGLGAGTLVVDGNQRGRVFHITPGHTVIIAGLTIINGKASGPLHGLPGGGIFNDHSTLTVSNCTIAGNSAQHGGAIINAGGSIPSATLTLIDRKSVV